MKITQDLITQIIDRARDSDFGLHEEPSKSVSLDKYAQHNLSTLAQILVGAFYQKYDLISVFQAAMEILAEGHYEQGYEEGYKEGWEVRGE